MGCILDIGAIGLVTRDDFKSVLGAEFNRFRVIVDALHSKANDFIHKSVVFRKHAYVTGHLGSSRSIFCSATLILLFGCQMSWLILG